MASSLRSLEDWLHDLGPSFPGDLIDQARTLSAGIEARLGGRVPAPEAQPCGATSRPSGLYLRWPSIRYRLEVELHLDGIEWFCLDRQTNTTWGTEDGPRDLGLPDAFWQCLEDLCAAAGRNDRLEPLELRY
jgi:hypothetical protein